MRGRGDEGLRGLEERICSMSKNHGGVIFLQSFHLVMEIGDGLCLKYDGTNTYQRRGKRRTYELQALYCMHTQRL